MRKLRSGLEPVRVAEDVVDAVPESWAQTRLRWEDAIPWKSGPEPFPGACALRDLENADVGVASAAGLTDGEGTARMLRIVARFATLRAMAPLHEPHGTLGAPADERADARAYVEILPGADPHRALLLDVLEEAAAEAPTQGLVAALREAAAAAADGERYGAGGLLRAALRLERRRGRTPMAARLAKELARLASGPNARIGAGS